MSHNDTPSDDVKWKAVYERARDRTLSETDPEYWIAGLKSLPAEEIISSELTIGLLYFLRRYLGFQEFVKSVSVSWIERFMDLGGLQLLVDQIHRLQQHILTKDVLEFLHTIVLCLRTILNSHVRTATCPFIGNWISYVCKEFDTKRNGL